jgi:hypothetical protein
VLIACFVKEIVVVPFKPAGDNYLGYYCGYLDSKLGY